MSNLFIKFTGIDGSATAQGYQGWSNLHSMHINISRHVNTQPGKTNDRLKGHPIFSGLTVVKPSDESTNRLLQLICSGKIISQVEIHACTTNAGFEPYEKFLLENVFIADFAKSVMEHGVPAEELKLDFSSIHYTYLPRDASHAQISSSTSGYDLTKAKVL
jgi:type VI secretion system Hcp family effector